MNRVITLTIYKQLSKHLLHQILPIMMPNQLLTILKWINIGMVQDYVIPNILIKENLKSDQEMGN